MSDRQRELAAIWMEADTKRYLRPTFEAWKDQMIETKLRRAARADISRMDINELPGSKRAKAMVRKAYRVGPDDFVSARGEQTLFTKPKLIKPEVKEQGRYTFSGQGRYRRKKIEGLGGWWKGPGFKSKSKTTKRRRFYTRPLRRYKRKPIYHRNPIIHQKRQLAFMKRRGITRDEQNAMSLGASLARASDARRATVEKIQKKRARFSNSVYDPEGTLLDSLLGGNNQAENKDVNSSTSSMMSRLSVGQL